MRPKFRRVGNIKRNGRLALVLLVPLSGGSVHDIGVMVDWARSLNLFTDWSSLRYIKTGLRIRIDLMRIRITDPDPAFFLIADQDPGFDDLKFKKNLQLEIYFSFSWSKFAIYLSLGLHKGRTSYRRSLQPSKENIQHFKTWKFCTFFYFCGSFFALMDPDPATQINPDPQPCIKNTNLQQKRRQRTSLSLSWFQWDCRLSSQLGWRLLCSRVSWSPGETSGCLVWCLVVSVLFSATQLLFVIWDSLSLNIFQNIPNKGEYVVLVRNAPYWEHPCRI